MLDKQSLIVLNNDNIIKVISQDELYYYGYDLITEEFKNVFRNQSTPISNVLVKLLGCQNTRAKIAMNLTTSETEATKILKISSKTLNRVKHKLKLI